LAGGEGFEPPTSGSGGLCPILARLPAPKDKRTVGHVYLSTVLGVLQIVFGQQRSDMDNTDLALMGQE
jgi:hypothetical protein